MLTCQIKYALIQTLDNQLPVILLVISLRSLDLKHPIPRSGPPKLQGYINVKAKCSAGGIGNHMNQVSCDWMELTIPETTQLM